MAAVTVFVDDAVRGDLPGVCVIDGVATADHTIVRSVVADRSGLGVAWILVLLGPLGWIALVLIAGSRSGRGEVLSASLPMSEAAYQRLRSTRRRFHLATAMFGLGLVGTFAVLLSAFSLTDDLLGRAAFGVALAAMVGGGIAAGISQHRLTRVTVDVELDASRRWVTLRGVHPAFVAAYDLVPRSTRV